MTILFFVFQQQIEDGGPVTVTHQNAERYFMTAHEAAGLILLAATIGDNKEVYLLDMGKPVRIDSLARTMIELSGMVPDQDIAVNYIGLKPGEKMIEVLSSEEEDLSDTAYPKIMRVQNSNTINFDIDHVGEFIKSASTMSSLEVKQSIRKFVSDFKPAGIE